MEKENVISMMRSCLLSFKGQVSLKQLNEDYHTIVGKSIPYRALGYKTLEDLIREEPTLMLHSQNGESYVKAKASEKSVHVSEMVDRQKAGKKKSFPKAVRFNMPHSHPAKHTPWRPKNKPTQKYYKSLPRLAAVSHNQFYSPVESGETSTKKKVENNAAKQVVQKKQEEEEDECTALKSTRLRINRKMSELSLDRDSGNSSPTNEPSPSPSISLAEFIRTDNPIVDLENFVNLHKLGVLEVSSNQIKKQKFHTCKIKFGKHIYTSYPMEFKDPIAAQKYCSQQALDELMPKYAKRKSLLLSSDVDILERIPPMLEKHNHGIWVWQLEMDYADKFNEQLPSDWLKIIDSNACIQVEKCSDNYVIRHCKPGDALQKGQKWSPTMGIVDVSVPSNTIQLDAKGQLKADVTCAISTNEVWCVQFGTEESREFVELTERMNEYYNKNHRSLRVESSITRGYFVAKYEEYYYRVKVMSVEGNDVRCFFIDYGEESLVAQEDLYTLKRVFALAQAQAFVCQLVGLEDLYEASTSTDTFSKAILNRTVLIDMAPSSETTPNNVMPVYMYDFKTGASVNQEVISLLMTEMATPHFQKDITEIFISNIEDNGDVYVQIHSRAYHSLQELLTNLTAELTTMRPPRLTPITPQSSLNKLYYGHKDGKWNRLRLIDWSPDGVFAQVYFVDHGHTAVWQIDKAELYELEPLSDVLTQYPEQAVKVRMSLERMPERFKVLAEEELPVGTDKAVLLKIAAHDDAGLPLVEFFTRNDDGGLFCINKSMEMKEKLKEDSRDTMRALQRKLACSNSNKNVPSGGVLKKPNLPEKDQYYEVRVPFAVNPWNFFIQPLHSYDELNALMERLQAKYKDAQYSPLHIDDIVPGAIYATLHEDGNWYRTSVLKVIHSGSISVFYCDYGYYANLTVAQLVPLDAVFMELPYQALKAKINGIKPKKSKWTMEDCDTFKALVEKKTFYSVMMKMEKDALYESDIVLSLVLIDTSSDDDIYVSSELIKKGVAVLE